MLTCIACSKQLEEEAEEDTARGTPSTAKGAAKSLTTQIKDMVLKFSGVYRQCKPGGPSSSSSSFRKDHHYRPYAGDYYDVDAPGSQSSRFLAGKGGSRVAWDFTRIRGGSGTDGGGKTATSSGRYEAWVPGVGIPGVETLEGGCCDPPAVVEDDEGPKEWVAQVEPGVHITFLALPQGGNDLKRIRFSREMFNKWQAQRWWGENYDRIMELYNVQRFNHQALPTPPRSEDERESSYSRVGSTRESPTTPTWDKEFAPPTTTSSRAPTATSTTGSAGGKTLLRSTVPDPDASTLHLLQQYQNNQPPTTGGGDATVAAPTSIASTLGKAEAASVEASRTTTSSRDEASVSASNASDAEAMEWVEQDEPGVFITIRQLADGNRELRRVRFSREQFGEVHAKLWWEENRERIHAQYL